MNTEILTRPSNDLKQHVQDLKQNAQSIVQDVKNQAGAGVQEIKNEANARYQQAHGTVADLYDSTNAFVAKHPYVFFFAGIVTGLFLARRRRS